MPRVASLYLPYLSTDRVRASEGRREALGCVDVQSLAQAPIPLPGGDYRVGHAPGMTWTARGAVHPIMVGRGGSASVIGLGGRTPSPQPSPPRGEGESGREPCSCPNESHWRPGARWARAKFTKKASD